MKGGFQDEADFNKQAAEAFAVISPFRESFIDSHLSVLGDVHVTEPGRVVRYTCATQLSAGRCGRSAVTLNPS